jgi:probable HAF family extracellular repeat protein
MDRAVRRPIVVVLMSLSCGGDTTTFVPQQTSIQLTPDRPQRPGASTALDAGGAPGAGGAPASVEEDAGAPAAGGAPSSVAAPDAGPRDAGAARVCDRFLPVPLPAGFGASTGTHLSGDGLLVVVNGAASIAYAHRWQQSDSMIALPPAEEGEESAASAVNRDGSRIVGWGVGASGRRALLWDGSGAPTPLAELTGATAVSADGSIVLALDASGFLRWTAGSVERISSLATVNGMSADGRRLVGTDVADAAVEDRAAIDIGQGALFVGLPDELGSRATLISEDGQVVVGTSIDGTAQVRVFLWQAGLTSIIDGLVEPYDVSADGSVIVGSTSEQCGSSAGIWRQGRGAENLGCRWAAIEPEGWQLLRTTSVSDDGRVVSGIGINPEQVLQSWVAVLGEVCP